jgi:hypothetical protein
MMNMRNHPSSKPIFKKKIGAKMNLCWWTTEELELRQRHKLDKLEEEPPASCME